MNQLDTELLTGYLDNLGQEIVQQMLDLYLQQSVVYLQDIEQAIAQESQELWQEHCHKMKGATGSAGLTEVHGKLVAIEKSQEPWSVKRELLTELSALNKEATEAFSQWLAQQA